MKLLSKNSGVFNADIQERKWTINFVRERLSWKDGAGSRQHFNSRRPCVFLLTETYTQKIQHSSTHDSRSETLSVIWREISGHVISRQINWHKYNTDQNWSLISILLSGLGKMWKGHRRLPGEATIIQKKAFSAIARSPWRVACRTDSLQGKALLLCWLLSHLCLPLCSNLFRC